MLAFVLIFCWKSYMKNSDAGFPLEFLSSGSISNFRSLHKIEINKVFRSGQAMIKGVFNSNKKVQGRVYSVAQNNKNSCINWFLGIFLFLSFCQDIWWDFCRLMVVGAWITTLVLASPQAIIFRWPSSNLQNNLTNNDTAGCWSTRNESFIRWEFLSW